jgi:DNA repair protein RadA/Sms
VAKIKSVFVCQSCGAALSKWQGQCADCGDWNSIVEQARPASISSTNRGGGYAGMTSSQVQRLVDITAQEQDRIPTVFREVDRVLGGGLVPGSVVLIGGNPGAGKSTLLLQVLSGLAQSHGCLYVTGEESPQQVSLRAKRMGLAPDALSLLAETHIETVLATAEAHKPKVLVVDSIQVMHCDAVQSAPGSVSQVRESAALLTRFAKQTQTVVLLVGHMTKEGSLAGPKVLEHMIDCSLLLEATDDQRFRILRSQKNRFGAVHEMGVFAMLASGMREVKNPSALFLSKHTEPAPGSVVTVLWEGTRPLLVEVQALVDDKQGGYPARITVGTDTTRLIMLLAILHKHSGSAFADQDVFINLVGGVRSAETSVDLAIALALISSQRNLVVAPDWVVMGEVGLSGEIRPMPHGHERMQEAAKHGFKQMIVPKANQSGFEAPEGVTVVGVSRLSDALACLC